MGYRSITIKSCVICSIALWVLTASADQPPPIDPALRARVSAILEQLESDNFPTRQAGSAAVEQLPPEALPLIEKVLSTGELSPEASVRLDAKVSLLRRKAKATAYEKILRQEFEWNRTTALASYDGGGHTNPKWDAAAREAIVLQVRPRFDPNRSPHDDARIAAALDKAINLGCDDPFLRYFQALRYRMTVGFDPARACVMTNQAATGIIAGHYPAFRKMMAAARAAETLALVEPTPISISTKRDLETLLDYALVELPDAVREGAPRELMYDAASLLFPRYQLVYGDARKALARVEGALRAATPNSNVADILLADYYLSRAEAVSTDQDPPSLRPAPADKPRVVKELFDHAAASIDAALAIDPQDPPALIDKLRLLTYLNATPEEFEPWYQKSMAAYPNNLRACQIKRIFLLRANRDGPDSLEFARSCLAAGNWSSRIPLVVIDAHYSNSRFDNPEEYFASDDVWNDVRTAEEGYLSRYPKSVFDRTNYAKIACFSGHWDIARAQFDLLGDNGIYGVFQGKQTYDYYRRKASRLGAAAAAPPPQP